MSMWKINNRKILMISPPNMVSTINFFVFVIWLNRWNRFRGNIWVFWIWCMSAFSYCNYVYFNDIYESAKRYIVNLVNKICHDIKIMTRSYLFRKYLIKFSRVYVENVNILWMWKNVHIFEKFIKNWCLEQKKFSKRKKCFLRYMILKTFCIIVIIHDFIISFINLLNWSLICLSM